MERLFKQYLWVLNLAVVVAAGWMAARTVSALAAARLAKPPTIEVPKTTRAAKSLRSLTATVDKKALARLFGMALPEANAEAPSPEPELPPPGTSVPSSLNATLIATVEATPPEYSLAVITDNSTRETGVYGIGDRLMGSAEILKVERRRVLVRNNGRTEYLEMDLEEAAGRKVAALGPSLAPARRMPEKEDSGLGSGIRKVGPNEYSVPQSEIEAAMTDLNKIATQARIVPAFKNGVAQGFKLFSIRPGSIYAKIGIQNGDVIKKINGYDINSPDKALEVYSKLKDARRVEVEIERRGKTITKVYTIE